MKTPWITACLFGLAVLLAGCDSKDHSYPHEAFIVNDLIDHTDFPMFAFSQRVATAKHWRVSPTVSMWALLNEDDVEVLRFSATTISEGKNTRVRCDVLPPESADRDEAVKRLKKFGAFRDFYKSVLVEQIDSKLTNRAFAMANIAGAVARALPAALPRMRQNMDAASAAYEKEQDEKMARIYAKEE